MPLEWSYLCLVVPLMVVCAGILFYTFLLFSWWMSLYNVDWFRWLLCMLNFLRSFCPSSSESHVCLCVCLYCFHSYGMYVLYFSFHLFHLISVFLLSCITFNLTLIVWTFFEFFHSEIQTFMILIFMAAKDYSKKKFTQ